jgi:propionyl-CoA carboxylase alpha chain
MIAKLVTHAPTRANAIAAQARALDAFAIDGINHNIPFLTALMQHPRWQEGRLSTGFIAEEFPSGFRPREPEGAELEKLAAVAAALDHLGNTRRRAISMQMSGQPVEFARHRIVRLDNRQCRLEVLPANGNALSIALVSEKGETGRTMVLSSSWWPGQPIWHGDVDGQELAVQVRPVLNGWLLAWHGIAVRAIVFTEREAQLAALMPEKIAADTSRLLLCPMPGLVKAINVGAGDEVKAGDALAVVEAMKMENVLRAERDGVVKAVRANPGDSLSVDAVILEFE